MISNGDNSNKTNSQILDEAGAHHRVGRLKWVLTFPRQTCGAEAWDWCSSSQMEMVPLKGCSMENGERTAAQKVLPLPHTAVGTET